LSYGPFGFPRGESSEYIREASQVKIALPVRPRLDAPEANRMPLAAGSPCCNRRVVEAASAICRKRTARRVLDRSRDRSPPRAPMRIPHRMSQPHLGDTRDSESLARLVPSR